MAGRPARTVTAVVERLLAVQGQDTRGVRLAIRARSAGLTVSDFERALDERAVVISWLNRGTLHLVRSQDYAWIHALTTPPLFTGNARRLAETGVTSAAAQRAVRVIADALGSDGPLTRRQLGERIAARGIRTQGQALVHLLMLACLQGVAVRGPIAGREQAYTLVTDWLGPPEPVARDRALAELARRYLAGHAPADARDLAKWAGITLRDARVGLSAISKLLIERADGLVELRRPRRRGATPRPQLLGAFEPVLLGWVSREFVVGDRQAAIVSGGIFRPFAWAGGHPVGVWHIDGSRVVLEPFARLSAADRAALRADGEDVIRYLAG